MVRLRTHGNQEDDENSAVLQLKSTSRQTGLTATTNNRVESPLKISYQSAKPRKQRILGRLDNNAVLLPIDEQTASIKPSKFASKNKATSANDDTVLSTFNNEDSESTARPRLSPIKLFRRPQLKGRNDTNISPGKISPAKSSLSNQTVMRTDEADFDDSCHTEAVQKPSTRTLRRRLIVDSDTESEAESDLENDIDDIFADEPLSAALNKLNITSVTDEELLVGKIESLDLHRVLSKQGFQFHATEPVASESKDPAISRPTTASELDLGAYLSFEPPKSRSPIKLAPARPTTPTKQSPTKSKLTSPTKLNRLPPSPHKPTSDEFWCPSTVTGWIDEHSPPKIIRSPIRHRFGSPCIDKITETVDLTQPSSPQKSPLKAQRQAKKDFNERKHDIAAKLLEELDKDITFGKIGQLSESTGGVKITWSNKLNSTAGRAHWRKQEVRKQHSDGSISTEVKHTASIELAEKVLDEESRLINTIAHEFCHLATFMIDGVKTNPHGKEFKAWARKCSRIYGHRGIEVTTKHSYEIDYKYMWECGSCGTEYKRHSKSIDPARHRCGSCKSNLVQTKPVPRKSKVTDYQIFVKENFQKVKNSNKSASHGTIMETLGKMYREEKAKMSEKSLDMNDLVACIEAIGLES